MTQDRDERTSLASFRYLGASSGSISVAVLTLPLVGLFSSPQYGFPITVGYTCPSLVRNLCILMFLSILKKSILKLMKNV
jgi:Na+/melibiose symporter-like transporter